jgi:lysozyme
VTIRDTFGLPALTGELDIDEGKERFPYIDTRGNLTGGRGRNLSGKGFSDDEIDLMFANDVTECCRDLDAHAPWWRTLPQSKQRVMINLCFMGWGSLSQFHKFLAAIQVQNYPAAAHELENSDWYKQVKERGPRVVERLLAEPGAIA